MLQEKRIEKNEEQDIDLGSGRLHKTGGQGWRIELGYFFELTTQWQ